MKYRVGNLLRNSETDLYYFVEKVVEQQGEDETTLVEYTIRQICTDFYVTLPQEVVESKPYIFFR